MADVRPILLNLTEGQRQWLEDESRKTGLNMTAVIKVLIIKEIEKGTEGK